MKIFWIDLFSGAGGTTTGIHLANNNDVKVVACVNHDSKAIESHKENHPNCHHFIEDVRDWNVVVSLKRIVDDLRNENPDCFINIWASLECTNYSKAKGGLPRDADSRTLAHALYMYVEHLNPDYLYIENVREFMAWGPLNDEGKPISMLNGSDYLLWINNISNFGYKYEWKILNAADFGAYTSRERYFGMFSKKYLPAEWPEQTHSKNPATGGMFEPLKKWKPVREVLDLEDEGKSIFTRKKPLVEATLKRIYAGLIKFIAGGEKAFTQVYNSGNYSCRVKSIKEPIGTLTTQNSHAIVTTPFFNMNYSGDPKNKVKSIDQPSGTITCKDHHSIVIPFLTSYYGNGGVHSCDEPCPTVTTKDRFSKVFLDQQYGNGRAQGVDVPAGTITNVPKFNLVSTHKWLMNPSWGGHSSTVDAPCPVVIARQDKAPLYVIGAETGNYGIAVFENDSETMVKIKEFMALYGIVDIKMRMLKIQELKLIQGFPENYILKGTQTDQKKFIGNAVVPLIAKALVQANANAINQQNKIAV